MNSKNVTPGSGLAGDIGRQIVKPSLDSGAGRHAQHFVVLGAGLARLIAHSGLSS